MGTSADMAIAARFKKLPFSHLLELPRAAAFLFCFLCIHLLSPSSFFFFLTPSTHHQFKPSDPTSRHKTSQSHSIEL